MMQEPLVSISLVAFNAENFIKDAVEGCLMQKIDFPYEIIIHDDASTDKTPDIIREYAKKYPEKIIPVIQLENQFSKGIDVIAKNIIPRARGKYIAFVEADDYWIDPLKLQKQVNLLESTSDLSMCFTATKVIYPNTTRKDYIKRRYKRDQRCQAKDIILMGGRFLDMISVVVRKDIFEDLPDWYYITHIWDITVPLLALTKGEIFYLNDVSAVYRSNVPGSWTNKNVRSFDKRLNNIQKSQKVLENFDDSTNYKYHQLISKRINNGSVGLLLLLDKQDEMYTNRYASLPINKKIEYEFFKVFGSYRLWERYRQILRLFRGY